MGTEYKTPSLMEPAAGFEPATYRLRGESGIFLAKAIWAQAVLFRKIFTHPYLRVFFRPMNINSRAQKGRPPRAFRRHPIAAGRPEA